MISQFASTEKKAAVQKHSVKHESIFCNPACLLYIHSIFSQTPLVKSTQKSKRLVTAGNILSAAAVGNFHQCANTCSVSTARNKHSKLLLFFLGIHESCLEDGLGWSGTLPLIEFTTHRFLNWLRLI